MTISPDERILDWKPRFDERSKDFPIRTAIRSSVRRKDKQWEIGKILDQGVEGACVGFAWAAEALAKPTPVNLDQLRVNVPRTGDLFARFIYGQARYLDEWSGENYDGTSVLAGAKASQNMGFLKEYRWAFNVDEIIDAVIAKGPVVIGVNWYDGMYEAPQGILRKTGKLVGGHALLVVGFKVASEKFNGAPSIILQNSWGVEWGDNGVAEMSVEDFNALFLEGGEACVPSRRSYGR